MPCHWSTRSANCEKSWKSWTLCQRPWSWIRCLELDQVTFQVGVLKHGNPPRISLQISYTWRILEVHVILLYLYYINWYKMIISTTATSLLGITMDPFGSFWGAQRFPSPFLSTQVDFQKLVLEPGIVRVMHESGVNAARKADAENRHVIVMTLLKFQENYGKLVYNFQEIGHWFCSTFLSFLLRSFLLTWEFNPRWMFWLKCWIWCGKMLLLDGENALGLEPEKIWE